jgi:hypothetical protein
MLVAVEKARAIVIGIAGRIVSVHAWPRHVVHLRLIIIVVAGFVVAMLDDALALDDARRTLDVGVTLLVSAKVRG